MAMSWIFILALLSLGDKLASKSRLFIALNFPGSLVGGMLGCIIMFVLRQGFNTTIDIPDAPRDLLLVFFFICSGLVMTISSWKEAGRSLISLSLICAGFIVLQNLVGILGVILFGQHPIYGIMNGSVSYAGGLGSAVAWGKEAIAGGADQAVEVGVVASTIGLLVSAVVCGPYVAYIMSRGKIESPLSGAGQAYSDQAKISNIQKAELRSFTEPEIIFGILLVLFALFFGDVFQGYFAAQGFVFPRFLTAMFAGISISFLIEFLKVQLDRRLIDKIGSICLNVFIVMTLSGLDLSSIKGHIGVILFVAGLQVVITIFAAHLIVFRMRGANYESLAMSGGFIGFLLGSFAVAMATVRHTEKIYGEMPRTILLVTLIGGAVSNLANALIIMIFFKLLL